MTVTAHAAPRYATGVLAVCIALAGGLMLNAVGHIAPFPLFLMGVLFCAWTVGLGPGLVATGLSALAIDFFFIKPLHTFDIASIDAALDLTVFALVAVAIATLSERVRVANHRAGADRATAEATWAQLEAIIDAAEEGLMVFDNDGRVRFVNGWLYAWFGVHIGTVPKTAAELGRLLAGEDTRGPAELLPTDLALRGLRASEVLTVRSRDTGPRRVRWRAVPIADHSGRIGGVVAICRDVSDQPDPLLSRRIESTLPVSGVFSEQSRN